MIMPVVVTCPACGTTNVSDAVKCTVCGLFLKWEDEGDGRTTTIVESVPQEKRSEDGFSLATSDVPERALALFSMNRNRPIILPFAQKVLLGRIDSESSMPAVNLMSYDGERLGVSRKHAVIACYGEIYTITDLDSTNGTWLNDQYLKPYERYVLNSMDELRLGNLEMLVYYQFGQRRLATLPKSTKLSLASRSSAPFTTDYMQKTFVPYLDVISKLQMLYSEIIKEEAEPIQLEAMTHDQPMMVRLRGASAAVEIIALIYRKLHYLGKDDGRLPDVDTLVLHSQRQGRTMELTDASPTQPPQPPAELPPEEPINTAALTSVYEQLVPEALVQFTISILSDISPRLSNSDKIVYATRMMPLLNTLVHSDLVYLFPE